jgi:antitoxin VapB
MALSIKNRELEETARELARVTGKSITDALLMAAKRELERQRTILSYRLKPDMIESLHEIQAKLAALPTTGTLRDDEILGYDEFGAPTK